MRLTVDFVKNALPESGSRLEVRDDDEPGLIFRVTASGLRSWSVRYKNAAGEHRRKSIGPFPAVSISKAREEARKIKGTVAGGADVVALERETRTEARRRKLRTVGGIADAYFSDCELGLHRPNASGPKRERTLKEERRIYDVLVKPEMAETPVADVTRADVQAFVSRMSKSSPSNGRFCRNVIRQIMTYAQWKDLITYNPGQAIAVIASKPRERVLSDDEVKAIWSACERPASVESLQLSIETGIALRLALVTLQRRGEIVGMRWDEIDKERRLWTIPASRMKGKRTQVVPLSDMALRLLKDAEEMIGGKEYVFVGRKDKTIPMRADAATKALVRIIEAMELAPATVHDFRRTGASNLTSERVGMPRFVVSQVLAHAGDTGGAAAVTGRHYDMNDYLPEKRRALDAWAALLGEIVTGTKRADNVTSIKAVGE